MTDQIANHVPVAIVAFTLDGNIHYANSTAVDLLRLVQQPDPTEDTQTAVWGAGDDQRQALLDALWFRISQSSCNSQSQSSAAFEFEWNPEPDNPVLLYVQLKNRLDDEGNPIGWVAVVYDTTGQRQAESKIRENENLYRTLFDHSGFGIALVDPKTGRRVAFNRKLHERLGYTREEYQHLTVADIQFDDHPERTYERSLRTLKEGSATFEERHRTKDGRLCHVLVSAVPVNIGGRELIHAISLDITEQKRLEMELLQAQKMEAIGRLAGGIAHDFNNLLNVMLGYSDLVLSRIKPNSQFYKPISEIKKAAVRSAELTKQLLAFSRKQIVTPRVVRLSDLVADQYEMLSRLIGEEIRIEFVPAKALWNVRIDPNQVHQILTNLAINARDAITGVGTIRIETANVSMSDSQTDLNLPAGEFVALTFQDTGMGMDSTILDHIFEPFFTTKAEGKGTGLGLATVYGIVKQNSGEVLVTSEPGHGSTIRLYFPRFSGADQSPAVAEINQAGHTPRGGETILIVEDEPQLLELATVILEKHGYRVLGTHHPTEAITYCRDFQNDIHLLLTDVVMPEMNGKQLQSRIKAMRPKIKALFVSGHTADIISARGVLEHGVDFIQKPYSIEDLTQKVRKALDR